MFAASALVVLAAGTGFLFLRDLGTSSRNYPAPEPSSNRISTELAAQVARIEARERKMAETIWAKEILAQECGRIFEDLWNALNAASNKWNVLASFPVSEILLGAWDAAQNLPHGIEIRESTQPGRRLAPEEWRRLIETCQREGWELGPVEFRQHRFETDAAGQPRESRFYFSAHLTHQALPRRAILEGDLAVRWASQSEETPGCSIASINAGGLVLKTRAGEPPFREMFREKIKPLENSYSIDPLILHDLDGDGLSEIILAGVNTVYRRQGTDEYKAELLCRHPPGVIYTAIIADFDGDGAADFLCAKLEGLFLFKGSPEGTFDEPGKLVWAAPAEWKYPIVLTSGDIDQDGHLDLFVGQYKVPYEGGAMPTPYYDANDGQPAFLLRNPGEAKFTDITAAAGLDRKRWRRCFSASFTDLDGDGNLDLVVVSDFAGVDFYRNDGGGTFTDVTPNWAAEPRAFGMGHALADFNADGRLDFLMIGMTSPTGDRLEHLNLWRNRPGEDRTMRSKMIFGNRLFLGRAGGGFDPMNTALSRSGWSWGCAAFDFDNDGYPDVYIANGLESRESVQDYEPEFWLHDRYVGTSENNSAAYFYFQSKFTRTRGAGQSYGGYEKNRFYLNLGGTNFAEVAHLLGVALQEDSRNVVADDLDGDGRVDLLVTSFGPWPEASPTLRIYKNQLPTPGNWIGFRFRETGGISTAGIRVRLNYDGRQTVRELVTGDSYRSQHANTLHFGLGTAEKVESAKIRWPLGEVKTLLAPALNQYHEIGAPAGNQMPSNSY